MSETPGGVVMGARHPEGWWLEASIRTLLLTAGLQSGMRVLQPECGEGTAAIIAADLVGMEGRVLGLDRDPAALHGAADRAGARTNVRFVQHGTWAPCPGEPFEALLQPVGPLGFGAAVDGLRAQLPALAPQGLVVLWSFAPVLAPGPGPGRGRLQRLLTLAGVAVAGCLGLPRPGAPEPLAGPGLVAAWGRKAA